MTIISEYAMYFTWNRFGKRWKPRATFRVYRKTSDETGIGDQRSNRQEEQVLAQEQQGQQEQQSRVE